jgi:HEAT repeat protein
MRMGIKKLSVGVVLALAGILVVSTLFRKSALPAEPVYAGKSVTAWIRELSLQDGNIRALNAHATMIYASVLAKNGASNFVLKSLQTNGPSYLPTNRAGSFGNATQALRAIGPPAIPYLVRALRKQDGPFRSGYVKVYDAVGRRLGRLLPQPPVDAVCIRSAAAQALAEMAEIAKPAFPALLEAINDPDQKVREEAIRALKGLSERDPAISAALTHRFIKPGMSNAEIVRAVAQFSLRAPAAIQALLRTVQDPDGDVREETIEQLRQIGPPGKAATPYLLTALGDVRRSIRCRACQALEAIKPEATQLVPVLTATLNAMDPVLRANAANALAVYGTEAASAAEKLGELYKNADGVERFCVGRALKQIDPVMAARAGVK